MERYIISFKRRNTNEHFEYFLDNVDEVIKCIQDEKKESDLLGVIPTGKNLLLKSFDKASIIPFPIAQ